MALELRLNGVQYGVGDDLVTGERVLVFKDNASGIEVVIPLGPEAREEIAFKLVSTADMPSIEDMKRLSVNIQAPAAVASGRGGI